MKKKLISSFLIVLLCLCSLILVSCVPTGEECQHDWQRLDEGEFNCIYGSVVDYECSKCHSHNSQKQPPSGHVMENGVCKNCMAGLSFQENDDGTLRVDGFYDPIISYYGNDIDSLPNDQKNYLITEIEIPSELDGKTVTVIGSYCFSNQSGLTSITIPNTVTKIEQHAFDKCTRLDKIEIPDSVTELGDYVFLDCIGLTSFDNVKLPSSMCEIPEGFFSSCGFTEVTVPSNITYIGMDAFYSCQSLEKISLHNGITTVINSFNECDNIKEIYYDVANGENVDFGFYMYSEGLNGISVHIGPSVEIIPSHTFEYLDLKSLTFDENSICHTIGEQAFLYCTGLTELNLPSSVTTVEKEAFAQCSDIASLTLGENLQNVGYQAFHGFLALENVYYNASNLEIDNEYVLWGYYNGKFTQAEKKIVLHIGENVENIVNIFHGTEISKINISSLDKWFKFTSFAPYSEEGLFIDGSPITSIVVPSDVTEVNVCFGGCTEVKEIVIHDGVTKIADSAFEGCTGTEILTIGKGVCSIGELAFADMFNLKTLNYNAQSLTDYFVHYYTGGPFRDMGKDTENGTTIYFGSEVSAFENHMLYGASVGTVVIPSIEQIFSEGFELPNATNGVLVGGEAVSVLVIPESVTEIPSGAFLENLSITEVVFHSGITKIGDSAFERCLNLTKISNLPSGCEIGAYAFNNCPIEALEIPNGATLGELAFASCNLTEITLGENVTLAQNSFSFANVECLELKNGTSVSTFALYGAKLGELKIGEGVTIEEDAFYGATIDGIYCDYAESNINENAFLHSSSPDDGTIITIVDSADILSKLSNLHVNEINLEMTLAEYCQKDFEASVFSLSQKVLIDGEEISGALVIPNGVTYIGNNAFFASNITSVSIPSSVEEIGAFAFDSCYRLEAINGGENVKKCGENAVNYDLVSETLYNGIYYKFNTISRLESTDITSVSIREGTKQIPERFFEGCQGLLHVYVPNGCEIGAKAFYNTNTGIRILLENASYPGGDWRILAETQTGNVLIGGMAYVNGVQTQIGSIVDGVLYDSESKFAYYNNCVTGYFGNEKNLVIPSTLGTQNITAIDERAFIGLGIESAECGTVSEVGEYSFALCTALKSIQMKNATEIGSLAFQGCTKLTSVNMEKAIYIRAGAFYGCSSLSEITIPSTVKYINNLAFYECNGLEKVTFESPASRWYLEGSSGIILSVDNPAQNAKYLKNTYSNYGWINETEIQ